MGGYSDTATDDLLFALQTLLQGNIDAEAAARSAADSTLDGRVTALEARVSELETKLQFVTVSGNDIYIDNANLHVRNGTGNTFNPPNSRGNIIIGYNELRGDGSGDRTGSHMLVVGGWQNGAGGDWSSISGGRDNDASGDWSSISGGTENGASGNYSSVSGGYFRSARGIYDWVAGSLFEDQ